MLDDDVLNNTPLALHIQKIGAEKEKQRNLESQKQTLVAVVQKRFSSLIEFAEKQVANLDKPEAVNLLIINIASAQSEAEAKQYLQQATRRRRKQSQNAS